MRREIGRTPLASKDGVIPFNKVIPCLHNIEAESSIAFLSTHSALLMCYGTSWSSSSTSTAFVIYALQRTSERELAIQRIISVLRLYYDHLYYSMKLEFVFFSFFFLFLKFIDRNYLILYGH